MNTLNNKMAMSAINSEQYKLLGATSARSKGNNFNAVYEDESAKTPTVDMFLQLMIAQMQNQDPMNPVDDTQYVTQMSQIAAMQQMQELAYYSRSNFVMSMVGNNVTVAQHKIGGGVDSITGIVEKVSLVGGEYKVYVKGIAYDLNQVMEIHPKPNDRPNGDTEDSVITKYGLSLQDTTSTSATVNWEVPTTEEDSNADLMRYTVYYSTSPDMDTVEQVKKGTRVGKLEETGINELQIKDLEPNTTYYANIIAKDATGKEFVYKKISFITDKADS